ncbi:MAG: DUF302 domain-containing protein [Gemmatimonadetes bacterium]|nr:DUF302 domain-containing protein [Gemmatimonadota bacterium]NNL30605.1 DUF302 domain-containing protein [Gemmatimonadota bacterium]NNM34056.1 DUF302 domain-containing protein [Gemmatimonadota bacterium]
MDREVPFTLVVGGHREDVIDRVTQALKAEGFGVLTRIDIDEAFKEKLGTDFRPYTILGACNPALAHRALSERAEVGLLLPCNVTVDESVDGRATVRIVDPIDMLIQGADEADAGDELRAVAGEARERLARVADALAAEP